MTAFRRGMAAAVLAAVLAVAGFGLLTASLVGSDGQGLDGLPSTRPSSNVVLGGSASSHAGPASSHPRSRSTQPRRFGDPSEPIHLTIPSIGVDAEVIPVGLTASGELEVPPLDQAYLTGWYRLGPAPGEVGNAVIVGHVDSYKMGPAVFFNLRALRAGASIVVSRLDGRRVQFTVDAVESFPKTAFPSSLVYAPGLTPGLRLVTCGGQFDQKSRTYLNNTIVLATATSLIR